MSKVDTSLSVSQSVLFLRLQASKQNFILCRGLRPGPDGLRLADGFRKGTGVIN